MEPHIKLVKIKNHNLFLFGFSHIFFTFTFYAEGHPYVVCSEYVFINKTKTSSIAHPTVVTKIYQNPGHYFGVMYCTILPSKDFNFLVLPYRSTKKLTYPFCRTCVVIKQHPLPTHR